MFRLVAVIAISVCSVGALPAAQTHVPKAAKHAPAPPATTTLHDLSASMELLSDQVSRSVVQVFSMGYNLGSEDDHVGPAVFSRQRSFGSGVVLSADGFIMTNAHVVRGARRVRVRLNRGLSLSQAQPENSSKLLEAKVIAADRETDLALIKIDAAGLPPLSFADSDQLKQGQLVLAFGSPLGLDNSVSMGVISAVDRQLTPDSPFIYIQTDAAINPGNSGGPLVDIDGHVVGINTFILSKSGGSEGVGFAIPGNLVRSIFSQMRAGSHIHHHRIGVFTSTITPALATGLGLAVDNGVLIEDVVPQSPAQMAGVQVGDIVLSIGRKPVKTVRQFVQALYDSSVEEGTRIEVLRGRARIPLVIAVQERGNGPQDLTEMVTPEKNLVQPLGILVLPIDEQVAGLLPSHRLPEGLVVAAGAGESAYFGDRPQSGDIIYSINGKPVSDVPSLRSYLSGLNAEAPVVLQVERAGRLMFLTLERD